MNKVKLVLVCLLVLLQTLSFAQKQTIAKDFIISKEFLSVQDGLASRDVFCVIQDKNGFIWFGTKYGLNRYDGTIFKLFTSKNGLSSNIISNLQLLENNQIIIQYGNQWDPNKLESRMDLINASTFEISAFKNEIIKDPKSKKIERFLDDYQKGQSSRIKELPLSDCADKNLSLEKDATVYTRADLSAQIVVNGSDGVYYIENKKAIRVLNTSDFSTSFDGNITHFFKDALKNIWICTQQGVFKISLTANYFKTYYTVEQQSTESAQQSRGIFVSQNANKETVYVNAIAALFAGDQTFKFDDWQYALLRIDNKIYSAGIQMHEFDSDKFSLIRTYTIFPDKSEIIFSIYQQNDSILYLGAIFNIYAYNRFTHTTKALPYKTTDIPVLKNVYRIFNSSKGVLALAENGIFLIKKGQIADYYGPFSKDKNKYLAINSFLDVHEDKNKCLWIATNGEGLYKWNWNKLGANTKLEQLTNNDGLSSMVLYRIEEDNSNNLWISSDEGIARLNPINNEIRLFRAEDGLPHHEFNRISSFKAEDGRIFFGALNGVVGFNPLDFKKSNVTHHVPFQVIGITKYSKNKEQVLDWFSGNSNKSIVFLPSDKLIKIEYALLDYKTRKKKYAYRISSVQKDWIYTNDNSLSIGSPPYGNHTIEIMAQLEDGTWLEDSLKIQIAVLRPFYLQIWFLVLSFLVFIGIVVSVIWFRSQRLKAQNANLEQKIIERTKDLQTALGDKDILLKELHHRVKNNLQIITGLLELQKAQLTDKKAIEALNEGQIRLSSIALIHQNFYSGDKLESVSFNSFLNDLVSTVKRMFGTKEHPIESSIKSADISIDINSAIPLGLILNELLTNSYKYLPTNQPNKKIEIELHELEADNFELTYKDNGPGLPENVSFENSKTLGLRLIRGLAQQIKGSVDYKFEKGSVFRVRFKAKSIK